jgi:pSer/pThr/pTyr-binding forkhead associated (FHA) protein
MKVVLELQEQLANVRRVTVRHDIVIGRGSDCNLRLSAPQMSRRHCFLRVGRDGVSVTDLDSSNGTYVDNKRIKPGERVELKTGSILTLGPVNFIVHLKEDSGSTTKSEGERSRKSTKSTSGASESSTIVSSAAAIIAEEFKSKSPLQYSVEQAGASAEPHEETARIRKDHASETVAKRTSSTPPSSPGRAEISDAATPEVTKATAAAISAAVVAPIAESIAKAEPVNASPLVESVLDSIDNDDSQSSASESSWLTDASPDDLSFFGGQQSDALAPPEVVSGSAAAGAVDDVVEDVVEVLDDDDIFADEVVKAVVAEEAVEAVEVLEDEPVEVLDEVPVEAVELLHDETPANALTADFEEADLPGNLFSEVLEEPELLAEEIVEAKMVEVIEEPVEVAQVLDDEAAVEVLEEPSDFFAMLGIEVDEPQQVIEPVAAVQDAAAVSDAGADEVSSEIDWFSDAVEDVVDVVEEPPAEAIVDEVQLFDDIDLINESSVSDVNLAAKAAVPEASALEVAPLEPSDPASSESPWDDVELSEVASPDLDGEFDFLNEEPHSIAVDSAAETEDPATATVDAMLQNENFEEFAEIEAEAEIDAEIEAAEDASVDDIEAVEEFDFFDDIEAVEPIAAIEPTVEQIDAVEEFDAEVEEIELFEEVAEAEIGAESESATSPFAEVNEASEAPIEEFAVVEEADAVEEAWDFSEIAAEDVVTEYQESPEVVASVADEFIEEEASEEEAIIEEEVLEVAEEDEASTWFDIGDDKSEDDDDDELRKFLKGF